MCSIAVWSLSQTATYQCHFQWSTLKDDENNLEQSSSISAWSLSQTATYQCHSQWSTLKDDENNLEQSQFCVTNKTTMSILTMDGYFVFNGDPSPLRGRMLDLQNLRMACRCYLFTILTSSSQGRPLQQFLSSCLYCLWALWSRCIVVCKNKS